MNLEQAVKIITEVCAKAVGNLQDHQVIQQALKVITDASAAKEEKQE